MVKATYQEVIGIEKIVCYNSQEKGALHIILGHAGKHQSWSGGRGSERKTLARALCCGFCCQKLARQGWEGLGLANLNNFSVLRGTGAVPSIPYLALVNKVGK